MILLVDANVLIDLWHVDGISVLPHVAPTEVLDIVLQECDERINPGLHAQVAKSGIQVVKAMPHWWDTAKNMKRGGLSVEDALLLFYATSNGRVVLTNERPLVRACNNLNVCVHGTLWLILQAFQRHLVPANRLCKWLEILPAKERRLPLAEVLRVKRQIGC